MFKKNTAVTGFSFGLVSATDGSDITTGTPVGYVTLDGGAQTAIGDVTPVHEGNGQWTFDFTAAEFNGDIVGITITHASAITVHFTIKTDTKVVSELQDISTAEVNAEVDSALTDYDGPTNAEMNARTLVAAEYFNPATDDVAVVTTLTNKTGFSLAATGLDAIASTATGMVEIAKAIWDRVLTGATHNIATSAGRRLRGLQDFGVYEGGLVWVNTVNGAAGTVDFENGTTNNPSLTMADAITLRASLNAPGWHIISGSVIVLGSTINAGEMGGIGYSLALGGRDVNNMHFFGSNSVTGIGLAATGMSFHDCIIGTTSLQKVHCVACSFTGIVTMTLGGDYHYINCQSGVAGDGTTTFNKTAGQVITAEWRRWSGSLTVSGIEAGDVITIAGDTLGNIILNGADGTAKIVGIYESIVDNRTGAPVLIIDGALKGSAVAALNNFNPAIDAVANVTLVDVTTLNSDMRGTNNAATAAALVVVDAIVDAILDDTSTTLPALLALIQADLTLITDIDGVIIGAAGIDLILDEALSGHVTGGTVGKALIDIRDSNAAADGSVNDAGATAAAFITNLTEATIDHYKDQPITFTSGVLKGQTKNCSGYVGATKQFTFSEPFTEAPGNGDDFVVGAMHVHSIEELIAALLASGDVDGFTLEETLRLLLASAAAKLSGAGTTTMTFRAADDSKDRITATVELIGNRTSVTLDGTP